jgi:hypothetical protein
VEIPRREATSCWDVAFSVVVSSASVCADYTFSSERSGFQCQFLDGTSHLLRWYHVLWYTHQMPSPAREPASNVSPSLEWFDTGGGTIGFGTPKKISRQ